MLAAQAYSTYVKRVREVNKIWTCVIYISPYTHRASVHFQHRMYVFPRNIEEDTVSCGRANLTPGQGSLLTLRPASAMSASPLEIACGVCQSALKVRKEVAAACCSRLTLLQVIDKGGLGES